MLKPPAGMCCHLVCKACCWKWSGEKENWVVKYQGYNSKNLVLEDDIGSLWRSSEQ